MKRDKTIHISMSHDEYEQIKKLSIENHISTSAFVRFLLLSKFHQGVKNANPN
jgi:hypothetical protein